MYRTQLGRPQSGLYRINLSRAIDDRPQGPIMPVNVWEEGEVLYLEAAVPGISAEALDITIQDTRLTLRVAAPVPSEERTYLLREQFPMEAERRLRLPYPVEVDQVTAVLRDGILTLTLPRQTTPNGNRIQVQAG
ncbi:MAG: hypothetical protein GEEBNDBF_00034 [bacterium]|nr:hypothetical protein [bacterium]